MNLYKIAKKYNMENELDGLRKKVHSCVEEKSFTVEMLNLNFVLMLRLKIVLSIIIAASSAITHETQSYMSVPPRCLR